MRLIADTNRERLDVFLARKLPSHSRSFLQTLSDNGDVLVDGQSVKNGYKLHIGDAVDVELPEIPDHTGQTLPIIYEDDDVLVINKPAGLLTHAKGALNEEFSVAEFMRHKTSDNPEGNRPGIVHRLDRGTSGVMIAAKTAEAKRWLQKQFSTRKTKKTYLALVKGVVDPPAAIIRLPIERNPKKPQTFRVGSNGKAAETAYETLQPFKAVTMLKLTPLTGRTHQLRVHLAYMNHPIIGDSLYGQPQPKLGRMFLHASSLELTLPSGERRVFKAPLPEDLQTYLDSLQ